MIPKSPVTMKKCNGEQVYWHLTCQYCPWSARAGDKITARETKRDHTKHCYHYLKRLGLR